MPTKRQHASTQMRCTLQLKQSSIHHTPVSCTLIAFVLSDSTCCSSGKMECGRGVLCGHGSGSTQATIDNNTTPHHGGKLKCLHCSFVCLDFEILSCWKCFSLLGGSRNSAWLVVQSAASASSRSVGATRCPARQASRWQCCLSVPAC